MYSVAKILEVPFTSRTYEEKQEIKKTEPESVSICTYHTIYKCLGEYTTRYFNRE
jgi:hypothetical protein